MSASRLAPVATLIASAFAAVAPASAAPAHRQSGVVGSADGGTYEHARVCVDRNRNARCDRGEASVFTKADGRFELRGTGALVAEVGTDAARVDPASGAKMPVRRPLVLRAPAGARGLGPLSTELQAMVDGGATLAEAGHALFARLGVQPADALGDPAAEPDATVRAALLAEQARLGDRLESAAAAAAAHGSRVAALRSRLDLDEIRNVVVIYAENRSFNNVFADFPGSNSLQHARKAGTIVAQKDRDGSVLAMLPPAWGNLTAKGQPITVTQAQTTNVWPNAPFQIDAAAPAWGKPALTNATITNDLYHRFFENQMQIDGGTNDQFVAWGDSGGLVMGWFDGSRTELWKLAGKYTLADNLFQGAFGGSFLNHQYLVCACMPEYPNADTSPAKPTIAKLERDDAGRYVPRLALVKNPPPSAMEGPPAFVLSGNMTPKDYFGDGSFRAVNTMQPAYEPSGVAPAPGDTDGAYADPAAPTTLPAQTQTTIGDLLTDKGVSWAWYSGGWNAAVADRTAVYNAATGNFQAHHQPFNYYATFDPRAAAAARAEHLKDYADLVAAAAAGTLPAVAFYKPVGVDNEHPNYASLARGDAHIADLVARLQASPQWKHLLIVVTYDENGGQWDNAAPPKADLAGPGTRVAAVLISPHARRGFVDHTQYDTGSILRFVTHRFALPELEGLRLRDDALVAHGGEPMGDLTNALDVPKRHSSK